MVADFLSKAGSEIAGAASVRNQIQSAEVRTRYPENREAQNHGQAHGMLCRHLRPFLLVGSVVIYQDFHRINLLSAAAGLPPAMLSGSQLVSSGLRLPLQITRL
jgi:hypothetical protein